MYRARFRFARFTSVVACIAMLASGATTLPEFWDGHGSQNHFMMGAIDDWSHRFLAGVRPTAPGFRRFVVEPQAPAGLDFVRATWRSPYGTIRSAWERDGAALEQRVTVPVNTRAELRVPVPEDGRVTLDGELIWDGAARGAGARYEAGRVVLPAVAGGEHAVRSGPVG